MLQLQVVQTTYVVALSEADMLAILQADQETPRQVDFLFGKLDGIDGVSGTDYDGHFGPKVWVTIEQAHDSAATRLEVARTIEEHIRLCRQSRAESAS
jgi:hypothetical protein